MVARQMAETVIQQLGGSGRLKAMVNARNFYYNDDITLKFQFSGSRKMNIAEIKLNGKDLYDLKFYRFGEKIGLKFVEEHNDLYWDMLKPVFEKSTGLYLSL